MEAGRSGEWRGETPRYVCYADSCLLEEIAVVVISHEAVALWRAVLFIHSSEHFIGPVALRVGKVEGPLLVWVRVVHELERGGGWGGRERQRENEKSESGENVGHHQYKHIRIKAHKVIPARSERKGQIETSLRE